MRINTFQIEKDSIFQIVTQIQGITGIFVKISDLIDRRGKGILGGVKGDFRKGRGIYIWKNQGGTWEGIKREKESRKLKGEKSKVGNGNRG